MGIAVVAALVAGLTGVGMASGPAVSAVLTYRLATYWLPIVPGWICEPLLHRFRVEPDLRGIFDYRQKKIREMLGGADIDRAPSIKATGSGHPH